MDASTASCAASMEGFRCVSNNAPTCAAAATSPIFFRRRMQGIKYRPRARRIEYDRIENEQVAVAGDEAKVFQSGWIDVAGENHAAAFVGDAINNCRAVKMMAGDRVDPQSLFVEHGL